MHAAYLLLFIDRGSGGTPGLVVSWNIHSEPALSQYFDGTQAAIVVLETETARTFHEAAQALRRRVQVEPFFQWLEAIPQATTSQITRPDCRRVCTWGCVHCDRMRATPGAVQPF